MAEEKIKLKEEIEVKTKWSRPEYQGYFEDLSEIIRYRLKIMSGVFNHMGGSESAEARNWMFRAGHEFYKELPGVVIGYFHRKGAFLSDAKDTHRLNWIIGKIKKGEAALDLRMARVGGESYQTFRDAIDDCMLQEKDS